MRNIPQRDNNPGDLKFMGQREATGKDEKGFATFSTPEDGWQALFHQIDLYQQRGLTIRQTIFKYAPPVENNTNAYLDFVLAHMAIDPKYLKQKDDGGWEVDPDTPIALLSDYAIAALIAAKEGYFQETKND